MVTKHENGDIMNWKEFLKPDKSKIMVFLAIIIIFLVIMGVLNLAYCHTKETDTTANGNPFVIMIQDFDNLSPSFCDIGIMLLNVLIRLPIWYLWACIIVFVYNKYLKRSK